MLEIDGSFGLGGGQILRTAMGLSGFTGIPCKVNNIRLKHKNPGLREQHIQIAKSVSRVCRGKITGAELGSTEIEFIPGKIQEQEINIKIGATGSIGLILQSILVPLSQSGVKVKITGGATWGKWSPSVIYLKDVLCGLVKEMGYEVSVDIIREGFFPDGGGEVEIITKPAVWKEIDLTQRGGVLSINGISVASEGLKEKNVAERQRDAASKTLYEYCRVLPSMEINYVKTPAIGSGIFLALDTEHQMIIGGSSLGEKRRKPEQIGKQAAKNLIKEYEKGGLDLFAADQLIPYLAIAGGKIKVSKITEHCRTNAFVAEKFLNVKVKMEENFIEVVK